MLLGVLLVSYETGGGLNLKMESCFLEEIGENVICGTYEVMENRQVRKGARITLNFIILPARVAQPAPDPIFIFSGGPGTGSAENAAGFAWRYERLRLERDIVLVDQRGTGASNPLHCRRLGDPDKGQTYLTEMFPSDYVNTCRQELEERAALRYYDTCTALADIDELRYALGYEQINVMGSSYGAYTGIVYMKYYPERVRCAFLGFCAPPGWGYPATIAINTQVAWNRLCSDLASDPVAAADFPDLNGQLTTVLDRLALGPVSVPIRNPFTGEPEIVSFSYNNFIHGLRAMLYNGNRSRWIPVFIHWARLGYFAPIAEYTISYNRGINEGLMDGMYLSVTCTETIPYIDYEQAAASSAGTFMGNYRLDQQINACDLWVRGDHPDDFHSLYDMDIPTLIVSGEVDPATPPKYGEEVAGYLPYSRHVIIPQAGHGFGRIWIGCMDEIVRQFISQGHTGELNIDCVLENERPPFVSWRKYLTQEGEKPVFKMNFELK